MKWSWKYRQHNGGNFVSATKYDVDDLLEMEGWIILVQQDFEAWMAYCLQMGIVQMNTYIVFYLERPWSKTCQTNCIMFMQQLGNYDAITIDGTLTHWPLGDFNKILEN